MISVWFGDIFFLILCTFFAYIFDDGLKFEFNKQKRNVARQRFVKFEYVSSAQCTADVHMYISVHQNSVFRIPIIRMATAISDTCVNANMYADMRVWLCACVCITLRKYHKNLIRKNSIEVNDIEKFFQPIFCLLNEKKRKKK